MLSSLLDYMAADHGGWLGHDILVAVHLGLAPLTLLILVFISAPYGRFVRAGWGPTVPGRLGWVVMETPAVVGFVAVWLSTDGWSRPASLVLGGLWLLHYIHRTYVFPFRLTTTRPMPVLVAALAFVYQCLNAPTQGYQLGARGAYGADWLTDPRFVLGVATMVAGIVVNIQADTILMGLRKPGETGYKIPRGGMYRYVTAANYLGECAIWVGFAVATWSLSGLAFALYTIANLAPRAAESHRWYRERFGADYPPERRRLVPFMW